MTAAFPLANELVLAEKVLRLRLAQLRINDIIAAKELCIPVHLALGHEAIAVAVDAVMNGNDVLALPHRNIHYNLARAESAASVVAELKLRPEGLAGGRLGAMNMANPSRGIVYTSSILANDLAVSVGIALAGRVLGDGSVTFVVTGDGAMEEGAFYEMLELMVTTAAPAVVVVENNGWSLATRIEERRCPIHLDRLAGAFGLAYHYLAGNDVRHYATRLSGARTLAAQRNRPVVVEVELRTLGDRIGPPTPTEPGGKFINYHAGAAQVSDGGGLPVIRDDDTDPVHALIRLFDRAELEAIAARIRAEIGEALQ